MVSYAEIAARLTRAGLWSAFGRRFATQQSDKSAEGMAWRKAKGLRVRVETRSERDHTKLNQRCFVFQVYRATAGDDH